VHLLVNVILLY